MTRHPVDWIDAFADRAFGGNACAVVHDADSLPVSARIAFVRETGLVECAYVVASDRADFGARYYVATGEIPMAGHPTVATVAALVQRGLIPRPRGRAEITLEVGAGVLPVTVEIADGLPRVTMTQAAPRFGAEHDRGEIAALYGLAAEEVVAPPQWVSTGTPFIVTLLRDRDALDRARLDTGALAAFKARHGYGPGLLEPFLVALGGATAAGDTFARLLMPPPMPPEDPFTGSATGCMAAYLFARGLIGARFTAEQGHGLGRPGTAAVEVVGSPDAIAGVRVGGTAVAVMSAFAEIPPDAV